MNKAVAKAILAKEIKNLREKSYISLCQLIDIYQTREIIGSDGKIYQLETQVFWDDKPNDVLRVTLCIDDGGWRAFFPMCDDFLVDENNNFIDEQ